MGFARASGGKREEGEEGNHLAEEARSKNIFLFFACILFMFFAHMFGRRQEIEAKAVIATARAEEEEKEKSLDL